MSAGPHQFRKHKLLKFARAATLSLPIHVLGPLYQALDFFSFLLFDSFFSFLSPQRRRAAATQRAFSSHSTDGAKQNKGRSGTVSMNQR